MNGQKGAIAMIVRGCIPAALCIALTLPWPGGARAQTSAPPPLSQSAAVPRQPAARGANYAFDTLEFKESRVLDAIRIIAGQSGSNIVATDEAGKRVVSIFLRHSTVRQAIESIARVSGLWYNYSRENDVYTLMTAKEYQDNLVVFRENYARSFTLRHQNVVDTARVIKALFGDRVSLTIGDDDAMREFQTQMNNGNSGLGGTGSGSRNNSFSTQNRQQQYSSTQGSTQQSAARSPDSTQRQNSQLTPAQLSLLQQLSLPRAEGGDAMEVTGASLADARNRDTTIYIAVNRLHNILFVRSSDETVVDQIAKIVEDSDRPTPQVLLEMKVLELTVGDNFNSLFDIGSSGSGTRTVTNADGTTSTVAAGITGATTFTPLTSSTLLFQVVNNSIQAKIQLLQSLNRVNVIATPMVTATNTTPAQLFIGEERIIVTGFTQNTTIGLTGLSNTFFTAQTEQRDVGTTLRIIPRINSDRTVTLLVQSDDSTINVGGGTLPVSNNNGTIQNLPIDTVSTSNIQGVVTAKDGLTVAMGGLIRRQTTRNTNKVPVLGDIPVLGFFFRNINNADQRSEIVVLITPHIFFTPAEADAVSRDRVTSVSANPDMPREGYPAADQARDGGVQALIALARAARLTDAGTEASAFRLVPAPLPANPAVQILPPASLSIVPRAAWRQGPLYATTVMIRNLSGQPATLDPRHVLGRWNAVSFDTPVLDPLGGSKDTTTGYFFSDRPFDEVMSLLTMNGARVPNTAGGGK